MNRVVLAGAVFALAFGLPVWAQEAPGVPTSVVITAEARHGNAPPELQESTVRVREAGSDRSIESLHKFAADTPVQLMLLIDESATANFDVQIQGLKHWVNSLPANVQVAVGYMQNGLAQLAQGFTADHTAAANAVHIVLGPGGADVSPYDSLMEAIKHWPEQMGARKEVVMITSGIEYLGGGVAPQNQYVNVSITNAQRAGVVVYGIYNPNVGHLNHVFWINMAGQSLLSQLCDETGGEAYITTMTAPVSFDPFLDSISAHLENQYSLTFLAKPESKAGMQPLRVSAKDNGVDVVAPKAVFVRASK